LEIGTLSGGYLGTPSIVALQNGVEPQFHGLEIRLEPASGDKQAGKDITTPPATSACSVRLMRGDRHATLTATDYGQLGNGKSGVYGKNVTNGNWGAVGDIFYWFVRKFMPKTAWQSAGVVITQPYGWPGRLKQQGFVESSL
jgi:hypothetical protein